MRLRSTRPVFLAAAAALAALVIPAPARAGGAVVPRAGMSDPAALDVRMAVASTPAGTTRWTEVTTPGSTSVLWLVPARPGAAIDWAPDGWLAALDDATAPRIVLPSTSSTCPVPSSPERAASWSKTATRRAPASVTVHATADGARTYAAEHGYDVSPALASRIASLYQAGWNLVSIELASTWSAASSGTLRVRDDGGAILPLALTGSRAARTYVTAFTVGPGVASLPGTRDVDAGAIRWGQRGSNYAAWRRNLVEGSAGTLWLRESASHAAIFEGTAIPGAIPATSVAAAYFVNDACTSSAQSAGATSGTLGISCAPGAAAQVPGGTPCTPSAGSIDPAAVSCGSAGDLALALSGAAPATAVVTRWAGLVPAGALGFDLPVAFDAGAPEHPPVVRAAGYDACPPPANDAPLTPPPDAPSSSGSYGGGGGSGGGGGGGGGGSSVYVAPGCGGSTTTASTTSYEEEGDPAYDDTTSDSCSGSTDTSSSSDGWDSSDSGDSCSADDGSSSSSSSDSCSGGSSSSSSSSGGSDDGWDTEDEASPEGVKVKPATKKPHAMRKTKKKPGSPVSRYALLAIALLLPLRRRGRAQL